MLAAPSQQTVTASLANPASLGSYFGVNSLSVAELIAFVRTRFSHHLSALDVMTSRNVLPTSSSETTYGTPFSVPTSYTARMLG